MSRPPLINFATDSTYSSGPASGTPVRVAPTSGMQTQGIKPGDALAAQIANSIWGTGYDYLNWLDAGVWEASSLTFSDFTFTASSSTDQLTATAHGLNTGDGPVRVTNSGGALPAGLAAATDYWVIKIDANTFQLATSFINAMLGVAIDLTSNGTGTQTLAATGSTVRPRDFEISRNLIVDGNATVAGTTELDGAVTAAGLITANAGVTAGANQHVTVSGTGRFKHGSVSTMITPTFLISGGFAAGTNPVNASFPTSYNTSGAVANSIFAVPFVDGQRLVNLRYEAAGNGSADLSIGSIFYASGMGAAATVLTTWSDINRAAAWGTVDVAAIGTGPAFTPTALSAGGVLLVQLVTNAAGYSVGTQWEAIFDRP